jgi:hypothetical protein
LKVCMVRPSNPLFVGKVLGIGTHPRNPIRGEVCCRKNSVSILDLAKGQCKAERGRKRGNKKGLG